MYRNQTCRAMERKMTATYIWKKQWHNKRQWQVNLFFWTRFIIYPPFKTKITLLCQFYWHFMYISHDNQRFSWYSRLQKILSIKWINEVKNIKSLLLQKIIMNTCTFYDSFGLLLLTDIESARHLSCFFSSSSFNCQR